MWRDGEINDSAQLIEEAPTPFLGVPLVGMEDNSVPDLLLPY